MTLDYLAGMYDEEEVDASAPQPSGVWGLRGLPWRHAVLGSRLSVTRHHHAEVSAHAAQAVLAPRWGTRAACDSSSCTG